MSESSYEREKARGLFVLGLLAVLVAIRYQYYSHIPLFGPILIVQLLDSTIFFWSLYAFFMAIGLSEDLLGKRLSEEIRGFSEALIGFSLLATVFLVADSLRNIFAERFILLVVLILVTISSLKRSRELLISYLKNLVRSILDPSNLITILFIVAAFMVLFSNANYITLALGVGLWVLTTVGLVLRRRRRYPSKDQKPRTPS